MRFLVLAFATLLTAGTAASADSGPQVTDAWARATPGHIKTGAAYLTIESTTPDRLVGASTPVAERAEIHEHRMDHGVMRMRQVTGGVEVVASKKIVFEPGGLHVMLIGLKHPLKEGESFPLTLRFQKAGVEQVTVAVQKPGAMGPRDGRSEAHDTHTPGS